MLPESGLPEGEAVGDQVEPPDGSDAFARLALRNPKNEIILDRLPKLGLTDCWLTAGCLFQTLWNIRSGLPVGWGIKDYDIFYFDGADLSWEAEDAIIRRAAELFGDLGVTVEFKNQARVHLWYREKFGRFYPQLTSARDGMDRFLITCTCVGIEAGTGAVHAPDGFDDLWHGILRLNPLNPADGLFDAKAAQYIERWPWLTVAD